MCKLVIGFLIKSVNFFQDETGKAHTIEELESQSFNWYNIDNAKNLENMTYKLGSEAYVIEPGYITIISKVKVSFDLMK